MTESTLTTTEVEVKVSSAAEALASAMHGEIITWEIGAGTLVHVDVVRAALRGASLDEKTCRDMLARNAFARGVERLDEARIIRNLSDSAGTMRFQFTRENKVDDKFVYDLEAVLVLDKKSGVLTGPEGSEPLVAKVQKAIEEARVSRTTSDISAMLKRLFGKKADLFPIRQQGGVYFVPQIHLEFVDQIEKFLRGVNGCVRRFPISKGTVSGDRSVRESVTEGIADMIEHHEKAIAAFSVDTGSRALANAAERIKVTRFKIEAYVDYLGEAQARLYEALETASDHLRKKVELLTAPVAVEGDVPETALTTDGETPPAAVEVENEGDPFAEDVFSIPTPVVEPVVMQSEDVPPAATPVVEAVEEVDPFADEEDPFTINIPVGASA